MRVIGFTGSTSEEMRCRVAAGWICGGRETGERAMVREVLRGAAGTQVRGKMEDGNGNKNQNRKSQ